MQRIVRIALLALVVTIGLALSGVNALADQAGPGVSSTPAHASPIA